MFQANFEEENEQWFAEVSTMISESVGADSTFNSAKKSKGAKIKETQKEGAIDKELIEQSK